MLLAVLAAASAYVGWRLGRGWLPWDDGALAHTAERVLQGELPHRDFDDIYTGGLGYLNAAAFGLFGTTLWTLRLVLLVFLAAWVPAVYYVASRFVRPVAAGAVTMLATVWSVPNYPAAMPSWYNLFFATFGVAALLVHLEDGRRRWLIAAGLAGGLSFLVKLVGLYYVAGALLFLVYQAHGESRAATATDVPRGGRGYALFVTGALAIFVGALLILVRRQLHAPEVMQFVLPGTLVAALVVWNEWAVPTGASRERFATLTRLVAPFLAGVVIPIALFLVPYVVADALDSFVNGVFVLPAKRFGFAAFRGLPPVWTMLALLPLVTLVLGARTLRGDGSWWRPALFVAVLGALFVVSVRSDAAYRVVWYSARNLPVLLVLTGVVAVARDRTTGRDASLRRRRTVLLLGVTALCSLVQFPFSLPIYFCYVAPLIALTAVAVLRSLPRLPAVVPAALVAFYAAFAVARVNGRPVFLMGSRIRPPHTSESLALPRGGIEIPDYQAPAYRALITTLRARARGGYTWASPDSPEIYFLSGLRNPTRSIFDFFDDPQERTARLLGALDAHGVTAIVVNREPSFSPPLTDDRALVAALEQRYPYGTTFGPYQLRWHP